MTTTKTKTTLRDWNYQSCDNGDDDDIPQGYDDDIDTDIASAGAAATGVPFPRTHLILLLNSSTSPSSTPHITKSHRRPS